MDERARLNMEPQYVILTLYSVAAILLGIAGIHHN